jgi:hypothetical protein
MLKKLISLKINQRFVKSFCSKEKIRNEEILLYVMNDKYSVKPDKEFRINHKTIEKIEDNKLTKVVLKYGKYIHNLDKHSIKEISNLQSWINNTTIAMKKRVISKLLPREYPYSVNKGYYEFTKYLFMFNVMFNAMNFLTTQVLINSLNLNISRSAGFAISAGLNWAIKEGIGQIGAIFYTTKYTNSIERNAKTWRLLGPTIASASLLLETTTLLFPHYFLFIATSANMSIY